MRDMDIKTPSFELVPIFNEYTDVFANDLPDILLERTIGFGSNILLDKKCISLYFYWISPLELKELKGTIEGFIW